MRLAVTFALVLLWGSVAQADDKVAAREAYKRATRHFNLAEYTEALADF